MASTTYPLPDAGSVLHHHNRDLALQKYVLLHEQHESLRQHLSQLRPLNSSPPLSPTRAGFSTDTHSASRSSSVSSDHSTGSSSGRRHAPSSLHFSPATAASGPSHAHLSPLSPVPDETTLGAVADDEARLAGINEGIKRALTELLNCEAVRHDAPLRGWVQERLMETERELRIGRRRRSAGGNE